MPPSITSLAAGHTFSEPDWNRHCAEFAAEHLDFDIWAEVGACPRSPKQAADLYRKHGVRCLKDLVTKALGPPVDPRFAMRGDVVMIDNALGVCRGELAEFMDRMQPMVRAECAWRSRRSS